MNDRKTDLGIEVAKRIQNANDKLDLLKNKSQNDPMRPLYHFRAPGGWMNDLYGLFHDGAKYHIFYQHNPYKDYWDNLHWGHAVSDDLIHWSHLPIALSPILENDEAHCYSGSTATGIDGKPVIFYTSIPKGSKENGDAMYEAYQRIALPIDEKYLSWDNYSHSIMLDQHEHQGQPIYDWRDPFFFQYDHEPYIAIPGNLNERQGGGAHVFYYKAKSDNLDQWDYQGILYSHPSPHIQSMECVNLIQTSHDNWLLFHSPYDLPEYVIGDMRKNEDGGLSFKEGSGGLIDHSNDMYAPTAFKTTDNRSVLIGWIRGFPENRGWSGCASLPRELTISDDILYQRPLKELQSLRKGSENKSEHTIKSDHIDIELSTSTELIINLKNIDAKLYGLTLHSDHSSPLQIQIDQRRFEINNKAIHQKDALDTAHKLHIFIDASVIEVFVDDRFVYTHCTQSEDNKITLNAFTRGGSANICINSWKLESIWND